MEHKSISINTQRIDDHTTIAYLAGFITDVCTSEYFEKQMFEIIDSGFKNLIINIYGLEFISTELIDSFVRILDKVKKHNGNIVITEGSKEMLEVLYMLGMDRIFSITKTLDEALELIK